MPDRSWLRATGRLGGEIRGVLFSFAAVGTLVIGVVTAAVTAAAWWKFGAPWAVSTFLFCALVVVSIAAIRVGHDAGGEALEQLGREGKRIYEYPLTSDADVQAWNRRLDNWVDLVAHELRKNGRESTCSEFVGTMRPSEAFVLSDLDAFDNHHANLRDLLKSALAVIDVSVE